MRGGRSVGVGIDQEIVVSTVDRSVKRCRVESNLYGLDVGKRSVYRQGVLNLRSYRTADPLVGPPVRHVRAARIPEKYSHTDASMSPFCEDSEDSGILSEEQSRVRQYAYLALGRTKEPQPFLARYGPSMRVRGLNIR